MTSCPRRAWLEWDGYTLALEDEAAGYFCPSLDLGWPVVREVMRNRPDADGADDRTRFMGARTVSANITAVEGADAVIDAVATAFARFMVASARPVLHWVLDRPTGSGSAERALTLRPVNYTWPIAGADQRNIMLQWVAADPVTRDPVTKTSTSTVGASDLPGRIYDLTFPRVYEGVAMAPEPGLIMSPGLVAVRPVLAFYGPVENPRAEFTTILSTTPQTFAVIFMTGTRIDANHFVEVDTATKHAWYDGDRGLPVLDWVDWAASEASWPVLPVLPEVNVMALYGDDTTAATKLVAYWQDGFLT